MGIDAFSKFVFTGEDSGRLMMKVDRSAVTEDNLVKVARIVFARAPEIRSVQTEVITQMFETTRERFKTSNRASFDELFSELDPSKL